MKNTQKGFVVPLVTILALLLVGGGVYFYKSKKLEPPIKVEDTEAESSVQQNAPIVNDSKKPSQDPIPKPVITTKQGVSQAPKNIPKSHNAFGFDLIKSIKKDEPGKNIFISPSSVALALSMVYNGANGIHIERSRSIISGRQQRNTQIGEVRSQCLSIQHEVRGSRRVTRQRISG
jgi:hypothetical protein